MEQEFLKLHEKFERVLNYDAVEFRYEENRKERNYMPKSIYPSQIGYGAICMGRLLREIIDWNKKPAVSTDLKRVFEAGNQAEKFMIDDVIDEFTKKEMKIETAEFQVKGEIPELRISGRCDGIVYIDGKKYVVEFKSVSPYSFKKLNDENTMKSDDSYHRIYYYQAQVYARMFDVDTVLMVYREKVSNEYRVIPVHRNEEAQLEIEIWSNRIWQAVELFLETGEEPDAEFFNPSVYVCKQCPHAEYCYHGNVRSPLKIFINPEIEEKIAKRNSLKDSYSEYKEIDDEIKSVLKEFAKQNFKTEELRTKTGVKFIVGSSFECVVKHTRRENKPKPGGPDTWAEYVTVEKV